MSWTAGKMNIMVFGTITLTLGRITKGSRSIINQEDDAFLKKAADSEKGIRILRQDPWEMLITFIISQNKNIPAITRSVEMLAKSCGGRKESIPKDWFIIHFLSHRLWLLSLKKNYQPVNLVTVAVMYMPPQMQ